MSREFRKWRPVLRAAATIGLLVFSEALNADSRQQVIAEFHTADRQLILYTSQQEEKIGYLGIANSSQRHIFSLDRQEWMAFTFLFKDAMRAQSANWQIVGSMTERTTSNASYLTLSAGPGVRIVIGSRELGAAVGYDLSRSDLPRFESALSSVSDSLSQ
jgi:hypothetical protein